jgi:alkyl sulfatase BDS1-like metallo-beta-lactamase superfamily hydrolase
VGRQGRGDLRPAPLAYLGNEEVTTLLKSQRDLYRFINDETLRMIQPRLYRDEIAAKFKLPDTLANTWSSRGYYGSISHNVKATYVLYLGWFDGNPATLDELPPVEAAKKYVDYMGGADNILKKAKEDFAQGNYRWVAQVTSKVVFADPDNQGGSRAGSRCPRAVGLSGRIRPVA